VQTQPGIVYQFGPFEVNVASGELLKNGRLIRLQEQPYRLLVALLENAGEVITREELRSRLWRDDTFVDFDGSLRVAVRKLREALDDDVEDPRYIETIPKRGYRFLVPQVRRIDAAQEAPALPDDPPHSDLEPLQTSASPVAATRRHNLLSTYAIVAVAVFLLTTGGVLLWQKRMRPNPVTDKDFLVLADFANSTGDAVFDGTLRQGLAVQLEQSPFLSLTSDDRIKQSLRMMGQPGDARLTAEIAAEVCQRTGSAAVIDGSIANLGNQYVLGLKAVNCRTGDALAEEQATVSGKERVLEALSSAAAKLRAKLGETLSTVQKYDTPLEQATTPSLEALQSYSLGREAMAGSAFAAALPFFERAIRLDSNFAMAYARLGRSYKNLDETKLGTDNLQKAYDLRERLSDREKLYIESHYYEDVTGDLEKARQVYELWSQIYPRDWTPRSDLGFIYRDLGQYDQALEAIRESVRLDPNAQGYSYLADYYSLLNRSQDAQSAAEEAQAKHLDSPYLHVTLYRVAFLQNDVAGMARQTAWAAGKPGVEDVLLAREADTLAYSGRLERARELSRRAVASAERAKENEVAAMNEGNAALREALFGNAAEGRQRSAAALALSNGRNVQVLAALALAFTGDARRAQVLTDDLATRFPESTVVRLQFLPAIRGQLELIRNDPFQAIETLQSAAPYELGSPVAGGLYPVYVRGEVYLAAHRGIEAAGEFEKIIAHRSVVVNRPTGALAHLGLARAYVMQGETAKAKAAYQDFLTLWKDADSGIPILKQAKLEYAKLQ
jgi:DNA-binding winged helix-turn-helix (wHTH) protein/tetratricopeptide (TPR) repeat protein